MWHVSIRNNGNINLLRSIGKKELSGVGDTSRGEWEDITANAFHLRRRISEKEEKRIGPAVDIRGTQEEKDRLRGLNII